MRATWKALVATAALGLGMVGSAMADVEYLYSVEGVDDVVENSQLLAMGQFGQDAFATLDGTVLTEGEFSGIYSQIEHGNLVVLKIGAEATENEGAYSTNGALLVPVQYADVEAVGTNWILGINLEEVPGDAAYDYGSGLFGSGDTKYAITTVDVYHVAGDESTLVTTLGRSDYKDAYAAGDYIAIENRATGQIDAYDANFNLVQEGLSRMGDVALLASPYTVFEDASHKLGLQDDAGNVVLEPRFSAYDISSLVDGFENGYARQYQDGGTGLLDESFNLVLPYAYDSIKWFMYLPYDATNSGSYATAGAVACGYALVERGGQMVYVDVTTGQDASYPDYDPKDYDTTEYGCTIVAGDRLIAADGVESSLADYSYAYALNNGSGYYFRVCDEYYNYGLIDWHGNVLLPLEYDDVMITGDGNYIVAIPYGSDTAEVYAASYPGTPWGAPKPADAAGSADAPDVQAQGAETSSGGAVAGAIAGLFGTGGAEGASEAAEPAAEAEAADDAQAADADAAVDAVEPDEAAAPADAGAAAAETNGAAPVDAAGDAAAGPAAMISSAAALLGEGSGASVDAALTLLQGVADALAENPAVGVLVDQAIALIESGDAAGAAGLLGGALQLLG